MVRFHAENPHITIMLLIYRPVLRIIILVNLILMCFKNSYQKEMSNNKSNMIEFIHDFFDNQKIPIKINAFLCWKKGNQIRIWVFT